MKEVLKLNNIFDNDYYIGDISIVINNKDFVLAKKDVILLEVDKDKYIDMDFFKNINNIRLVNEYLLNNVDNNIILSNNTSNLYIGKLFISNLKYKYEKNNQIKKLTK